jgi:DNA-binding MarR family transcriptional regulator
VRERDGVQEDPCSPTREQPHPRGHPTQECDAADGRRGERPGFGSRIHRDTILFLVTHRRSGVGIADADYGRLLELRTELRRFLHWSEQRAAEAGLTPAQHQLLLAVRGSRDPRGPTIGDIADALLLRHNSAVELVGRAEALGLVSRTADRGDRRVVRLRLTTVGNRRLEQLAELHLEELRRLAPSLKPILRGIDDARARGAP